MADHSNADSIVTIKEVCNLIRVASQHAVSELKFGPLSVTFSPRLLSYGQLDKPVDSLSPVVPLSSEAPLPIEPLAGGFDGAADIREDVRQSMLLIDDPLAFEQEMEDSHLQSPKDPDEEARYRSSEQALSRG